MVHAYEFEMAANTVTMAIVYQKKDFSVQNGRGSRTPMVLVGWRQDDSEAYPGAPCLPGGFLDIPETTKAAATRETKEETHLTIDESRWRIFFIDDTPGTDPRYKQVINTCYQVNVTDEEAKQAKPGDDLKDLKWVPYDEVWEMDLAFNHNEIIEHLFISLD